MADPVQTVAPAAGATVRPGAAVALLHCSAGSGAQWRDIAAVLAERFSVVAPDLPGGGAPMRIADHARFVRDLVAPAGAAGVVGHSFGGAVGLRLALDSPASVRRLVLIEPVAFHLLREGGADDRRHYAEIRQVAATVFDCALAGRGHAGMARFVDYWGGPGAWAALPAAKQARLAAQIGTVADNFTALFADSTPLARYRAIAAPTLVLCGGTSPAPARRVAALVAGAIPGATLRIVPEAGHMLPMTHPGAAQREIADFLAADRAAGPVPKAA